MTDYKATLNLPKTEFPMKGNLPQREPEQLRKWQSQTLYNKIRLKAHGRDKFILHDGPPYANGNIHIGHALNKILKDIIVKAKTLSGYDAPFVPGWDCHGLPIELNVEKKHGKAGHKLSSREFRLRCREYAASQVALQSEAFQRLGVFGDWENPYLTMAPAYEADIIRSLGKIISRGHLTQGFKPVHWCLDCQSALAEAEVEYEDKASPSIDVRFQVLDDAALLARFSQAQDACSGPIHFPIWTTTPWTLPANRAIALNPNLAYALVACEGDYGQEYLVLAESLIMTVMSRFGIEKFRVMGTVAGSDLEGLQCQHPFYNRQVPIVLGDHVTTEAGTGNVHTAPAHGQDDYQVAQRYHLPIDNPVADNGCYTPNTELFAGEHVLKANDKVIEVLKAHGKLLHLETIQHSYPHCWRHKTPVIFRATPQWFVSMDKENLRRDALEAIFQVSWIPDWGQSRIAGMIESRPDWCISRQRAWGTPIPLFVHKETGELHPESLPLLDKVADLVAQDGIDAWFELEPSDLLIEDADHYRKVTDTLDVWFDSGVSHTCVLEARDGLHMPADLYLEGSDQHRGWFHTSLLSTIAMYGTAPYLEVLTHGFTVDAKGLKMSKSKGNVIAPEKVIKQFGADVLRLWVASTDFKNEQAISNEILQRTADIYRRIRNTLRFLLANLFDFDPNEHLLAAQDMLALDSWIVDRARLLQREIKQAYDEYQFNVVYQKLHQFCSADLGGFYLDIIKDRQYTMATASVGRRSCQTAMYHIACALVHWLAPILSFTAEEAWTHLPGERDDSVFLSSWYSQLQALPADAELSAKFWDTVISVRDAVNKELEQQRNNGAIRSALEASITLYCEPKLLATLSKLEDELRFVLITSSAELLPATEQPESAVSTEIAGLALVVAATSEEKCVRCWHRRADVGSATEHPELCGRCVENVAGSGEQRRFA